MKLKPTAAFEEVPQGYIGNAEELPGANTQAATLEEARVSLFVSPLEADRPASPSRVSWLPCDQRGRESLCLCERCR